MRVWAPGKNSWGPGLTVSRTFGDRVARKYGIISEPHISCTKLKFEEEFLLLGTDGLFSHVTDQDLVSIINQ